MSRAARFLVAEGLATETAEPTPGLGRPRQVLSAVPAARHVIGCKLTGTTAYAVVCDMSGAVRGTAEARLPEPAEAIVPLDRTIAVVAGLIRQLARTVPSLDGVGISIGGIVRQQSVVQEGTFLGWREVDLAGPLATRTGLPVVVSNDVTALAREQLWFGAGRTHSTFGVVTIGAGLGYALVREGVVVEELIDNGHLLMHAPLAPRGPRCSVGHRGCVAAYLDRQVVAARAAELPGRPSTLLELARARDGGSQAAKRLLDEAGWALGHLVATVAGAVQSTRVVLAGEDVDVIANSPPLQKAVAERVRPGAGETMRVKLDLSTEPLTNIDWARGTAVVAIQHILGAP